MRFPSKPVPGASRTYRSRIPDVRIFWLHFHGRGEFLLFY